MWQAARAAEEETQFRKFHISLTTLMDNKFQYCSHAIKSYLIIKIATTFIAFDILSLPCSRRIWCIAPDANKMELLLIFIYDLFYFYLIFLVVEFIGSGFTDSLGMESMGLCHAVVININDF